MPARAHIEFRRELGLPTDRPVVMTGHQPVLWHCGILAKYLAADASRPLGYAPAWLVVDQDDVQPALVPYPAMRQGALTRATLDLDRGAESDPPAGESVSAGLDRVRARWAAHAALMDRAVRMGTVLSDLLSEVIHPAPTIFATRLAATAYFQRWIDAMTADPVACIEAYNRAATSHSAAGIRPLEIATGRVELPLWLMPVPGSGSATSARTRVTSDQIPSIDRTRLAPRALLQTAILRAGACELFIHGTGGAGDHEGGSDGYDRVMEDWLRHWRPAALRPEIDALAPMALVTATRFLPLPGGTPVSPAQAHRARQFAHQARHDPNRLQDATFARQKSAMVQELARRDTSRLVRAQLFRDMHALLERYRSAHPDELAKLDAHALELRRAADESHIRLDRTWPWPLFPRDAIDSLKREIHDRLNQ